MKPPSKPLQKWVTLISVIFGIIATAVAIIDRLPAGHPLRAEISVVPHAAAKPGASDDLRHSYVLGTIRNDGEKTLETVVLTVPGAVYVVWKMDADEKSQDVKGGKIELGAIRAKGDLTLQVWTKGPNESRDFDEIKLVAKDAVGKISFQAPAGALARWFGEYWPYVAIAITVAFAALVSLHFFLHSRVDGTTMSQPATGGTTTTSPGSTPPPASGSNGAAAMPPTGMSNSAQVPTPPANIV